MTATTAREQTRAPAAPAQGGALAGAGTLVPFILRRDRIKLPAWLLGITFLLFYFHNVVAQATETEEQLQDVRRFMEGTIGALFGPGYGRDDITTERYLTNVYGVFFFVLAALMSMLLVSRHTRVEEQSGRSELIRSNVVGRHAQLTATLAVAAGANIVLALLLAGALAANGHDAGQGLLFGAAVAAVGLVFAGITALTVQVTEYSRTATSLAGAVLGTAWVVRAVGDMLGDHGSPLSWFSPLAWSNQTRVYVDGRWWPLLLSAGLAAAAAALGYALSGRRDVGAGLVAARTGAPEAAPWLGSPLTAAFRLQRAALIWWTAALAAFGFVFGAVTDQIADPDDISGDRLEMFGGSLDTLADGYLGVITLFIAVFAGVMVVLGVQSVWAEESKGRAEPILATATSRTSWFGGYLAVIAAGLVGLLLVAGFATGLGAAVSLGDGSYILDVTAAHLAHVPGVLVMLGIAALLFGVFPRAIGVVWAVLGYSLFAGLFGTITDMPQAARNLMPMEHVGQPPLDGVSWTATVVLLLVAVALSAAGLAGFRRRDLKGR
ncbi:ABC-2 type transport system permease protein [Actinomadura hallensis]|uniref:ABC-2 type transport system permease protein n=1 Tax=Actinomadura hallensis TaxID=337895 RepID=A0A543IMW8_9ACTN|nr:anibiotic ABC transporter efflux pump [Actinomadura hallensis]TQM71878.1 ABC-2 type transport system permease protein [Actinomadura hallensis]